jgi:hypothetical protein
VRRVAYIVRAVRWLPLGIAAGLAAVVAVSRRHADAATPIEAISILLASALGYLFDDPAADTLDALPMSLLRRRLDRVACVVVPTVTLWIALVWVQGSARGQELAALSVMFAGLVGLSLGVAGTACRHLPAGRGGLSVGPAVLALLVLSTTFPARWRPLPLGDIPGGWTAIRTRWATAAVAGLTAWLCSSRDRANRPIAVHLRPVRHRQTRGHRPRQ